MYVTYKPEGQEPVTYPFRPQKLKLSALKVLERTYPKLIGDDEQIIPWDTIKLQLQQNVAAALQLALWWCQKQANPPLKVEDVDPAREEIEVQQTKQELREFRETFLKLPAKPGEEDRRALMLADIDRRIEEAPDETEGKAPERIAVPATASRSRSS